MTHTGYILAAYAFTALVIGTLIVWSIVRYRTERRTLQALEKKAK